MWIPVTKILIKQIETICISPLACLCSGFPLGNMALLATVVAVKVGDKSQTSLGALTADWLKQLALKNRRQHEWDPLQLLMLIRVDRWRDWWDLLHNWGTEMAMANFLLPSQWGTG